MRCSSPTLLLLATCALTALPPELTAGGFHISILGARRTGMMTNIADPDDGTALFHNPAGLADQGGTRLHLGSGLTFLKSDFSLMALDPDRFPEVNPKGCGGESKEPCPWPIDDEGYYEDSISPERYFGAIPYLGVSQGLGDFFESLDGLTVSLAAYAPGAYGAFLPEDAPTAYFVTEGMFITAAVTAGVGWRIHDMVSVGLSASYNYLYLGYAQKFSTQDALAPAGKAPGFDARMAQAILGDLLLEYSGKDHGFGLGGGVLINPLDWLALGASFSWWTSPRFEGDVSVRGLGSAISGTPGLSDPELRAKIIDVGYKLPERLKVDMPIPPALNVGLNLSPTWWLELGVDLRWWFYSLYEEQKMIPIYDPDIEGKEPLTEEALSKDKRYSDSWEIAVGVLVRPLASYRGLELMAGCGFDKSPVPDETFSIDNPSMNQLVFSFGVRALLWERLRVGAGYLIDFYLRRDITTNESNPPVNVRVQAISHIPTVDLEYWF